jgi:uncharacterized repeat protein (TIGR03803 family)
MVVTPAQAQTYKFKVLHTFHGKDGAHPVGQLVRDKAGNLYGTTGLGGDLNCNPSYGCGTAFKMTRSGEMVWVHSFNGTDGRSPQAGLLRDVAGNLFGTTIYGGEINSHICPPGCGVMFKLDRAGNETVLHKFTGPPDGYLPEPLLVENSSGTLYGTTYTGGNSDGGTVFGFDSAARETILYNFTCGSDGCSPDPGVILDAAGNLYGVTLTGGSGFANSGYGVVYEVDSAGNETVLHTFEGSDGANPNSVLLFDSKGNLYGTTQNGGTGPCQDGCGTVFELSPGQGGAWSENVLYSFCSLGGCTDGFYPDGGPLVRDAAGNLYGTTNFGGNSRNCNGGCGVVFKLDTTGGETVLHSFTGGADGAFPSAGLTTNSAGALYGAAFEGGDLKCPEGNGYGCGVVFKITP